MARYFFDVVTESGVAHDFRGRELATAQDARCQGELVAIDLQQAAGGSACMSRAVSVRDVQGMEIFSIAVADEAD